MCARARRREQVGAYEARVAEGRSGVSAWLEGREGRARPRAADERAYRWKDGLWCTLTGVSGAVCPVHAVMVLRRLRASASALGRSFGVEMDCFCRTAGGLVTRRRKLLLALPAFPESDGASHECRAIRL